MKLSKELTPEIDFDRIVVWRQGHETPVAMVTEIDTEEGTVTRLLPRGDGTYGPFVESLKGCVIMVVTPADSLVKGIEAKRKATESRIITP